MDTHLIPAIDGLSRSMKHGWLEAETREIGILKFRLGALAYEELIEYPVELEQMRMSLCWWLPESESGSLHKPNAACPATKCGVVCDVPIPGSVFWLRKAKVSSGT